MSLKTLLLGEPVESFARELFIIAAFAGVLALGLTMPLVPLFVFGCFGVTVQMLRICLCRPGKPRRSLWTATPSSRLSSTRRARPAGNRRA